MFWHLSENDIIQSQQLIIRHMMMHQRRQAWADNMFINPLTEVLTADIASLTSSKWNKKSNQNPLLTGAVMSSFLHVKLTINPLLVKDFEIIDWHFYEELKRDTLIMPNGVTKEIRKYNYQKGIEHSEKFGVQEKEYMMKDIIFIIHIMGNHWIVVILSYRLQKIFILDYMYQLQKEHIDIKKNLILWWYDEYQRKHNKERIIQNSLFDIKKWTLVAGTETNKKRYNENNTTNNNNNPKMFLPNNSPRQTDGHSCGVFAVMTAYIWATEKRLLNHNDFTQIDAPMVRLFIAKTLYDHHNPPLNNIT